MADAEVSLYSCKLKNLFSHKSNEFLMELSLQLSKALRDLPNRVLNVGVEERHVLFQNVSAVLSNPGESMDWNMICGCIVSNAQISQYWTN